MNKKTFTLIIAFTFLIFGIVNAQTKSVSKAYLKETKLTLTNNTGKTTNLLSKNFEAGSKTSKKTDKLIGTEDKTVSNNLYASGKGIVNIGTGTLLDKYPVYPFYGYSYTQTIYLQSELQTTDNITKIWYYFAGASLSSSNNWTIYMGHTTKTQFDGTSDWVDASSLTQVFTGTFTNPGAPGWIEFDISDFAYNGTDNLVIAVDENASSYNASGDKFYSTQVTNNRSIIYYSDGTNPDPFSPPTANTSDQVIANIRILFGDPLTNDLAVTQISPLSISSGNTIQPTVRINNYGLAEQTSWTITLTDGGSYDQTLVDPGTIAASNYTDISFPDWTPADGTQTLTASVILANDEDLTNNTLVETITVAEFINMTNGTAATCNALFFDSGEPTGDYLPNENYTFTFTPATPGTWLQVEFNSFLVEGEPYDYLQIYNGLDASAELLAQFGDLAPTGIIKAANPDGALTFVFISDGSVQKAGWEAEVSCFTPPVHDLEAVSVAPSFIMSGTTVQPKVILKNNAINDESSYSINYENYDGTYFGTISYTDLIVSGQKITLLLPPWSPADGNDTLTVAVNLTGDENNFNDTAFVYLTVASYSDAYTSNATTASYNNLDIATGTETVIGTVYTDPLPMAEEYNGTAIYRINADLTIGTVAPDGSYSNLGIMTGLDGIPTALAYDWANDIMYVSIIDTSYISQICTLNTSTLELTVVGPATGTIIGMDFAWDGNIYAATLEDILYLINPATGVAKEIGPLGININYGQDVTFDGVEGKLYTYTVGTASKYGYYDLLTGAFVEIADGGTDQRTTIVTTKTPLDAYTVTFHVTDINTSADIEGAEISITGGPTISTDFAGTATYTYIDGALDYTVSKFGYEIYNGSLTIAGTDITEEISLTPIPVHSVTFNIADINSAPVDATVTIYAGSQIVFTASAVGGTTVFSDVPEGNYTFDAEASGYTSQVAQALVVDADEIVDIELLELLTAPYGLLVNVSGSDAALSWNNSLGFSDDFESYPDFTLTFDPWILIDVDGGPTYGFSGITFPNAYAPMAGIIFNPSTTEPALDPADIIAYSGEKFIAIFNSSNPLIDDDWIIAPKTQVIANDFVKFYARSGVDASYINEKLQIFVSTTGINPADFTAISSIITTTQTWTEYSADLSAYAGQEIYVAIHCTSADQFFVCIDDFSIGQNLKSTKTFTGYNVYLNDVLQTTSPIAETNFDFTGLTDGLYTASVESVYSTGVSPKSFINFEIGGSEVQNINNTDISIYPNPSNGIFNIELNREYTIQVIDITGKVIKSDVLNGKNTISIENSGVYFIKFVNEENNFVQKVIVK